MRPLSIARSLRLALLGLTLVLAILAGLGVAGLYHVRQRYEDTLSRSAALQAATANLLAAGVVEEATLRQPAGRRFSADRRRAARAFEAASASAAALARGDPASERLVTAQAHAQARARHLARRPAHGRRDLLAGPLRQARADGAALATRQRTRQLAARARARKDSRDAILLIALAGVLALIAALSLVAAMIAAMRRPLDTLVAATQRLASGRLEERVDATGPRELRELGAAFNAMAADLATAHRQIESERARLEVTIESLGDALLVCDPDGTITAVNPRAGELVPDLVPGTPANGERSPLPPLQRALAGEVDLEDGERTLAITATRLAPASAAANGAGHGAVWTIRDVSERARLERAKTDWVATASHELRSPLTSIKGFVELLQRSPELRGRQREFVEIVMRSTDRLVELVNDLLDVARMEGGRMELRRRPIALAEVVLEVCELMGPRLAAKDQDLAVNVASSLPLVLADAQRMRQVVANLITNAHHYTDQGGSVEVTLDADGASLCLTVADTGQGMSAAEVEHAFDRFYRGDDATPGAIGSGLGLSIVKSIVDLHEGTIELQSEPGAGTKFRVLIPAAVLPGADAARQALCGRRVLVVDDEPGVAQAIAVQLREMEVDASVAHSGAEALEALRSEHFDAVTLDLVMPDMDGFAMQRVVRADPELSTVPIVFVSIYAGRDELAGEWAVGKPPDPDELAGVLAAAVSAGRTRVLAIGRPAVRGALVARLERLGIEHRWESTVRGAARACAEQRFEVALLDAGVSQPQAYLRALDLRGRRSRQAVIVFSVDEHPAHLPELGVEVVPVEEAAEAVLATLGTEG